jgi:hypothetical protein
MVSGHTVHLQLQHKVFPRRGIELTAHLPEQKLGALTKGLASRDIFVEWLIVPSFDCVLPGFSNVFVFEGPKVISFLPSSGEFFGIDNST